MEIVSSISPMLVERLWRLEDSCQTKRRSLARAVQKRSPKRGNKRIWPFLFHNPCCVPTQMVSNRRNASMQITFLLFAFSSASSAFLFHFLTHHHVSVW